MKFGMGWTYQMKLLLIFTISYPPSLFIPTVFIGKMKTTAPLSGRQSVGASSAPGTNPPKVSVPGAGGVLVKKLRMPHRHA